VRDHTTRGEGRTWNPDLLNRMWKLSWFSCSSSLAVFALSFPIPATLNSAFCDASRWILDAVAILLANSLELLLCELKARIAFARNRDALHKLDVGETDALLIHATLPNMSGHAAQSACFEINAYKGVLRRRLGLHTREGACATPCTFYSDQC
jgi:hypothetical protein